MHAATSPLEEGGGRMVAQMIMGAGKTTVVGPLLALMLGDGKQLVVQVVPKPLLEFSRSVMRERFSAIIQKPIYTFHFDRFMEVDAAIARKMTRARDMRAGPSHHISPTI